MQSHTLTPFNITTNKNFRWLASVGETVLGLNVLDKYYRQKDEAQDVKQFIRYALETLGVEYSVANGSVDEIPSDGPLIIVANHPFGAIEGIILAELLLTIRDDVKILANEYLQRIPEMQELFLGVDVFSSNASSMTSNMLSIKQSIHHVSQGGVLLLFPAGEVSSLNLQGQIMDKEWNRIIGMLVRKTSAQITPVYIEGRNSHLFHLAGVLHPGLRTLMLVREMLNKQNKKVNLHIGNTIGQSEIRGLESDEQITQYLRLNTYLMAERYRKKESVIQGEAGYILPVADESPDDKLFDNVMSLSNKKLLLQSGDFDVYCATAKDLPEVLDEIGRLREISFRAVGEGTGLSRDIDHYDKYYLHLFIWDRNARCIVGAYRLGLVDQIIEHYGIKGLYSRSLFGFNKKFIASLNSSIELGRSFIRPEYQRNKNALLLLWKGIAAFVHKNPKYTTLFGPVSISNDYSEVSRALITSFLKVHHYDDLRAGKVKATNPLKKPRKVFWTQDMISKLSDNKLISKLVERMEGDKGLPILIKQYLGLNGRLVSFNVDKDFNDVLDGLIIVDLLAVPEKVLARYMGKVEAQQYLTNSTLFDE